MNGSFCLPFCSHTLSAFFPHTFSKLVLDRLETTLQTCLTSVDSRKQTVKENKEKTKEIVAGKEMNFGSNKMKEKGWKFEEFNAKDVPYNIPITEQIGTMRFSWFPSTSYLQQLKTRAFFNISIQQHTFFLYSCLKFNFGIFFVFFLKFDFFWLTFDFDFWLFFYFWNFAKSSSSLTQ